FALPFPRPLSYLLASMSDSSLLSAARLQLRDERTGRRSDVLTRSGSDMPQWATAHAPALLLPIDQNAGFGVEHWSLRAEKMAIVSRMRMGRRQAPTRTDQSREFFEMPEAQTADNSLLDGRDVGIDLVSTERRAHHRPSGATALHLADELGDGLGNVVKLRSV